MAAESKTEMPVTDGSELVGEFEPTRTVGRKKKRNMFKKVEKLTDFYNPDPYAQKGGEKGKGGYKGSSSKSFGNDYKGASKGKDNGVFQENAKLQPDNETSKPMAGSDTSNLDGSGKKTQVPSGKPRGEVKGKMGKGSPQQRKGGGKGRGPLPGTDGFAAPDEMEGPRSMQPTQPRAAPVKSHMGTAPAAPGYACGSSGALAFATPAPYPYGTAMYAMPYYVMSSPPPYASRLGAGGTGSQAPGSALSPSDIKSRLLTQVEYYFDIENLCKDVFLRQNMNEEGWVQLSRIANFSKIKMLTADLSLIVEALSASDQVEMDQSRTFVRLKIGWQQWLLAPAASLVSGSHGPTSDAALG